MIEVRVRKNYIQVSGHAGQRLNMIYRPEGLIYIMGIFQRHRVLWWIPFSLASV